MTSAIMASDPMVALAEHQLEMETVNADVDAQDLRAARNQEQAALNHEVDLLHEAARDVRRGAIIQGTFTLAGAAGGMTGELVKPGTLAVVFKSAGAASTALAAPMGHWTGDAAAQDDQADAKRAEAHAADARSRAEEADHHHQRMEQASDRTLSTVDEILSSQAQGNLAVIANV